MKITYHQKADLLYLSFDENPPQVVPIGNPIQAKRRLNTGRGEPKDCRESGGFGGEWSGFKAQPALDGHAAAPAVGFTR
jgi:hypothetical protein